MALPDIPLTEKLVHACRAFIQGQANAEQQKTILDAMAEFCHEGDIPYMNAGTDGEVYTLIGRRQVAKMMFIMQSDAVLEEAKNRDLVKKKRGTK